MISQTGKLLRVLTGLTVAGLAIVAGAISFAHMTELATAHGQTGWKAYAFPVSVDGLELVASLYILAQRRAGRRPGPLPWAALLVGTAASLAANVAVGGHDPVGRALAGWPAISLLVSIKLLFSMFDHSKEDQPLVRDDQRTVPDDQRPSADGPAVPRTVHGTGPDGGSSSGTVPARRTDDTGPSAAGAADRAPVDIRIVAHLIPAARAARAVLAREGRSLSRDALADAMRDDGHGVSNARASLLLKILRAEDNVPSFRAGTGDPVGGEDRRTAGGGRVTAGDPRGANPARGVSDAARQEEGTASGTGLGSLAVPSRPNLTPTSGRAPLVAAS